MRILVHSEHYAVRAGLLLDTGSLDTGNLETRVHRARLWRGDAVAQDESGMLDAEAPAGVGLDDEQARDAVSAHLQGYRWFAAVRVYF